MEIMTWPDDIKDFPLSSLEKHPLHESEIWSEDHWWACSEPERPPNIHTTYDWRCKKCLLAAQVNMHLNGGNRQLWVWNTEKDVIIRPLEWLIRRAEYWLNKEFDGDNQS